MDEAKPGVQSATPVAVVPGFRLVDIAAGGSQSFARAAVNEEHWLWGFYTVIHLWAWGDNQFGQLGGLGTILYIKWNARH